MPRFSEHWGNAADCRLNAIKAPPWVAPTTALLDITEIAHEAGIVFPQAI